MNNKYKYYLISGPILALGLMLGAAIGANVGNIKIGIAFGILVGVLISTLAIFLFVYTKKLVKTLVCRKKNNAEFFRVIKPLGEKILSLDMAKE